MSKPTSTRRQFLVGRAAVDALGELVDRAVEGIDGGESFERRSAAGYLLHVGRRAMACQFEIYFNAGQYPQGTAAAVEALDLVEALEAQLTVYRDGGEVMEINRLAASEEVPVEARLFALLQQAVRLYEETGGAFDITSGPLSKVWGFYRRQGRLPEPEHLAEALQHVGSRHLELDGARRTIRFHREGVELNLGSIGKGHALDRAAETLSAAGVGDFLFHGGQSSVLARGNRGVGPEKEGWSVGVGDPRRPGKRLAEVRLRDRALGTSGSAAQFFRHQGRRYGHILDPRTGQPAEGVFSATAIAATAAEADALATSFYVMGPDAALEYCRQRPELGLLMVCPCANPAAVEVVTSGIQEQDVQFAGE